MRRLIIVLALGAAPLAAQDDWTTLQQPATWLNTFVDHAVAPRTALWFDGHWRRMDLGAEPQQVLLRPGVQVTLRDGLRAGGGYAYIATAPYGESPNPLPIREHRTWQQLVLSSAVGSGSVVQRLRLEQRWGGVVQPDGDLSPFTYQQRVRYFARAQRPLAWQPTSAGPALGFVANEFFLPIGHDDALKRRFQNRAQVGVGIPIDARQRVELGYLHQWSRITSRQVHEWNHTLVLSWVWVVR
ncbi:MAG: DUF2490 domain-containing protein [Gemmatimonadaceae bacterium]|nr:DUF2490 domain-containing protein [Gemmatimonadaceae bacterium]MCW5826899.1 DUF2490 domain-containing protein [Gemmatimonadaceae bacterium]